MCPACVASAAWVVGSAVSTGGLTALAVKVLGKNKKNNDSTQRSNDHGNSDEQ